MSKFRKSAKGQSCTLESWLQWEGGHDPETVVLAHAPHPDRGKGYKSHPASEIWSAFLCNKCHDALDYRDREGWECIQFGTEGASATWLHAIRETQRRWIQMGLLPND